MITKESTPRSHLAALRAHVPDRSLTATEARHVAERQATKLLHLANIHGPAVPVHEIAAALPRVVVRRVSGLGTSGQTSWNGHQWMVLVDADEPGVRRRMTLAHELAHVVYHPLAATALQATGRLTADARLERHCEYFAACLLMPRAWVKRAYFTDGFRDVPSLARLFDVSWEAMRIRLEQLGIATPAAAATEVAA